MTINGDTGAREQDDTADLTDELGVDVAVDAASDSSASDSAATDSAASDSAAASDAPADDEKAPEPAQPITDAVWRYHLDVLVGEAAGSQSWQATDPVLGRQVGVRLLPSDDPRAHDLREAACLVARVSDRRLVHVLDVVDVKFEGRPHLAVVTEWVTGRPLPELLQEPLPTAEAMRICADVAECLAAAHAEGIAHGRLRPASVLLTEAGDVRVRGLGTEAVLRGCDPDPDPAVSDINGVGGLLYATATGRWPYGNVEGVTGAPVMGGSVPLPSRVAPAVPALVDSLCARSVAGCTTPKDAVPFASVGALATTLRASAGSQREAPSPATGRPRRRGRVLRRLLATIIGLLAVAGIAMLGWQLLNGSPSALSPRPTAVASATPTTPAPTASVPLTPVERPLPIIRVSDYDPLGNGAENPDLAPSAIDGKAGTAWNTVTYKDDYLSGKDGVGLLLDLGAPRPVKAVRLSLLGNGTDLKVLTSDQPSDDPATFGTFGGAIGAPGEITLRSPRPVTARYVLIWITRVPAVDQGYQGGVSEVTVLG